MEPLNFASLDTPSYKWIFVGGKGGVGKTTTACTIAVTLAMKGRRVCIVSTDPASNIGDAFQQHFSEEAQPVNGVPNLFAIDSTKVQDFEEIPVLSNFPGIDELHALTSLFGSIEKNEFDIVIFDTAPTGHTMRLLSLPETAGSLVGSFGAQMGAQQNNIIGTMISSLSSLMGSDSSDKIAKLRTLLGHASERLRNPIECTFVCVLLPEFLPLYETERLISFLDEKSIESHVMVINQILDPNEAQHCKLCKKRSDMQQKYLSQIDSIYGDDFQIIKVPLQDEEIKGVDKIIKFSQNLASLFSPNH